MRLKKLKVSGFKSFVDPTDIRLPGNLVGVVGPNGCGKSNVIDACRWVMGEASAKMLRGDSMADVIFNGSASRKAVSKSSVELVFDNNDGKAGGNYGQFAEISVQRTLTRDGQSTYFINGIKVRRKDVLDLFRGTGLGPRSYSIIEQGMVSRIVEARPDELRAFVEEAAGTSRYKDRRRETESRINHTRENLERVQDISNELDKQLRRLQRQSSAARRYKVLKQEQRQVNGQLQVLKVQSLEQQLVEQDRITAQSENDLEQAISAQRATEAELEKMRKHQSERQESNNQVQQNFVSIGAEIHNIEQRIEHLVETRQRQGEEIERLEANRSERMQELESDNSRISQFEQDIAALKPELGELQQSLEGAEEERVEAESHLASWQQNWEAFNRESEAPVRQKEVQQSRINQLGQHLQRAEDRKQRLESELASSQEHITDSDIEGLCKQVGDHDAVVEQREQRFAETEQRIRQLRENLVAKRDEFAELRAIQQEASSRLRSLKEIQAAALGGDDGALNQWLDQRNIDSNARLAKKIIVHDGWQRAADRVINGFTGAVCVEDEVVPNVTSRPDSGVALLTRRRTKSLPAHADYPRLIDKVSAEDIDLQPIMADVYIADDLQQALAMQSDLFGRDSAVTRDGTLVGANWISFATESQAGTGVLVREQEIKDLEQKMASMEPDEARLEQEIGSMQGRRGDLENNLQKLRVELNQLRAEKTSLHNRLGREEARVVEVEQRSRQLTTELAEMAQLIATDHTEIAIANSLLEEAASHSGTLEGRKQELLAERDRLHQDIDQRRAIVIEIRDRRHQKQLQVQRLESALESVREHLKRIQQQLDASIHRLNEISGVIRESEGPVQELRDQLAQMVEKRVEAEKGFAAAREEMSEIERQLEQLSKNHYQNGQVVNQSREQLEQKRLQKQEVLVRKQSQDELIVEQNFDREQLLAEMPEEANAEQWQQNLMHIEARIERIGPVNLVAIEEFEEESARKEYLDKQHADLTEALETLESVIRKIDRETRTRFRQTFDKLNAGFNEFFPQLFGGGKAELLLTSDDLLTAGIAVMARPPGKRNSTIHLLSGGEKALTAVALLFSLFKLNPAPFCMLDEVDAPLDDANVDRYCNTLKKLSEVSQIVIITHNKITMEATDLLVGVTMAEPGVSRLVSVDISEAVEMVSQ